VRWRRLKKLDKSLDYEDFQTFVSKVMISTAGMEPEGHSRDVVSAQATSPVLKYK
jgi:hypothetical protein